MENIKNKRKILQLFVHFSIHQMCTPLFKFKMHETGLRAKAYSLIYQGMRGIQHTSKKEKVRCKIQHHIEIIRG